MARRYDNNAVYATALSVYQCSVITGEIYYHANKVYDSP